MQFMSNPSKTSEQARDKPIAALPDNHPAKRVVNKARKSTQRQSIAGDVLANREYYNQLHEQQPQRYDIHRYTSDLANVALAGSVTAGLIVPPALTLALLHRKTNKR